jgi:hypothetical protein
MGNFSQTIWQRFRSITLLNNDQGDTESLLSLIPTEKAEMRKPRPVRRGGNPGKKLAKTDMLVDVC